MTQQNPRKKKLDAESLRKRAEKSLGPKGRVGSNFPTTNPSSLIHELSVHQVELEIQNEELRNAQVELGQSRDRFSDLYDFSPVGYVTLDKDSKILEANLKAAALLGTERKSFLKRDLTEFIADSSQDTFYLHRQAVFSCAEVRECELEMRAADGTPMIVQLESITRSVDDLTQCQTVLIDVTELRKADRKIQEASGALRISEERLRLTLDTISEGILTTDSKETILDINPALEQIFGYTRSELIGQKLKLIVTDALGAKVFSADPQNTLLENSSPFDSSRLQEKLGLRKDGSRIPIEVSVDFASKSGIYVHRIHDISEKRRLEQEILSISESEKHELAYKLHNSLCQELSGLGYMAATLAESLKSESHPNAGQAERIYEKIDDSMKFSRDLSHSLGPLMEGPQSLTNALRLLAATTSEVFKIDCQFSNTSKISLGDSNIGIHLYRIAQEAVNNAIRHGKSSNVTLTLEEEEGRIELSILDNGSGLKANVSQSDGIGLRLMKYRIATLGGWSHIRNRDSGGVAVLCNVPKSITP